MKLEISEKGNPILTPDLYWEWSCAIEQLQSHNLKIKIEMLESKLLEKEIEVLNYRLKDSRRKAKEVMDYKSVVESSYKDTLNKIELASGLEMKNCGINPMTFEIENLEKLP